MTTVRVSKVTDFAALGARWRDLEQRANPAFFQTWSWTGCLAAERFSNPVLVEATDAGRTVALALFNRRRRVLYLGESGDPAHDCPYIEHNAVLAETARTEELSYACLAAVAHSHVLVLSGIGEPTLRVVRRAAGQVRVAKRDESPVLDLDAIRHAGGDYLATRSANTRQQIRRSDRFYAGIGPLTLRRAASVAEAHAMLDTLAALHQATWTARGKPGSFAQPFFARFHHALIDIAFPRNEIDLLTLSAGETTVGVLYNLRDRTGLRAYQSGFDYQAGGQGGRSSGAPPGNSSGAPAGTVSGNHPGSNPGKPGLSCHHAAIRLALSQPVAVYDFLAGNDRYKRSLASQTVPQYWIEAGSAFSPGLLARRVRQGLAARRQALA